MESQRSFLVIGLALVSFLLWQQWQKDYGPQPIQQVELEQQAANVPQGVPSFEATATNRDVPVSDDVPGVTALSEPVATNRIIEVKTDTFDIRIDLLGGDVISTDLLKYPVEQGSDIPFSLLRSGSASYIAQSGLTGAQGPDASPDGRPVYRADKAFYELTGDTLVVPLVWMNNQGLKVVKTFTFTRDAYDVKVDYQVTNNTSASVTVQPYAQLKQSLNFEDDSSMFMPTYRGAAYSTADDRYVKYTFDDIIDENLKETTPAGWAAMLEHYFVAAWVPPQDATNVIYSSNSNGQYASIGVITPSATIAAGDTASLNTTLYMGPKKQDKLAELARGLDLTVDYGFLWWISKYLFALLVLIHSFVNNWGVAIILITIIVKGAMYWLTKKQYESMAKMRNLAPKMQQLKDRFGDDRQKMSQAMMELYKKEKLTQWVVAYHYCYKCQFS